LQCDEIREKTRQHKRVPDPIPVAYLMVLLTAVWDWDVFIVR
jgi:hypothetical protein